MMSLKRDIIFHLGLHKTGTTFLQREIFPKLSGVNYKVYNETGSYELNDKINLISCEALSGNPTSSMRLNALPRDLIIYGIKSKYPEAKIIVGFRNKEEWLKSIYSQSVKQGKTASSYNKWYEKFDKRYLDFEGYLNLIQSLFTDVYVYNLEDLQRNSKVFVHNMCEFIGTEPPQFTNKKYNKAWKGWRLSIGRLRNLFFIITRRILDYS